MRAQLKKEMKMPINSKKNRLTLSDPLSNSHALSANMSDNPLSHTFMGNAENKAHSCDIFPYHDHLALKKRLNEINQQIANCAHALKLLSVTEETCVNIHASLQRADALIAMARTSQNSQEAFSFLKQLISFIEQQQNIIENTEMKGCNLFSGDMKDSFVISPILGGMNIAISARSFMHLKEDFFADFFANIENQDKLKHKKDDDDITILSDIITNITSAFSHFQTALLEYDIYLKEKEVEANAVKHMLDISHDLLTAQLEKDKDSLSQHDEEMALSSFITKQHPAIEALLISIEKEPSVIRLL